MEPNQKVTVAKSVIIEALPYEETFVEVWGTSKIKPNKTVILKTYRKCPLCNERIEGLESGDEIKCICGIYLKKDNEYILLIKVDSVEMSWEEYVKLETLETT